VKRTQRSAHLPRGYWNPVTETMPREELRELQWRKLQKLLLHVYAGSPFYRERMNSAGCRPDQLETLDEYLRRFPILTRRTSCLHRP
jgi:phenylacetate-CoA ligase